MSERNLFGRGLGRATRLLVGSLALAAVAAPGSAYVVVTSDNRVFDVPSKPEVRGDLVLFMLDGQPVSLRVYDVNVTKTNELNYLLDTGAGAPSLTAQLRQLRPAVPQDDRLMVGSNLNLALEAEFSEESRVARGLRASESPSFDRDSPGMGRTGERPFAREARSAMDEAQKRVGSSRAATATSADPSEAEEEAALAAATANRRARRPSGDGSARVEREPAADTSSGRRRAVAAQPPASDAGRPSSGRRGDRAAALDAEIAAEQEYLRRLTAGEVTVSDLEREIDESMAKIKRLQKQRGDAGNDWAADGGRQPAGSREAKWEAELRDARAEMDRLKAQREAASGSTREREGLDERIGELEWKIERLEKRLAR